MGLFAQNFWNRLRGRASKRHSLPIERRSRQRRLELETLEDRSVPSATTSGVISGLAFIDPNHTGVFNAQDSRAPSVLVNLTGTTTQGSALSLSTNTDAHGVYTFLNVAPGTYQLNVANAQDILAGSGATVTLNANQSLTQNLASPGLAPQVFSFRLFLASTTAADLPAQAQHPSTTPTVTTAITPFTVSASTDSTPTVIDLAANFGDPAVGDTMVQFNTSSGPVDMELFDSSTPQTVANFLDYIDSGDFDDSIFHRVLQDATDGLSVVQGGGFTFQSNNGSPQLATIGGGSTLPTLASEFKASNVAGTIAMALSNGPATATDEFFFNVGNNAAALDSQSFTVFGQILGTVSKDTLNTLDNEPRPFVNLSGTNATFTDLPFTGSTNPNPLPSSETGPTFPVAGTTASNFSLINSIDVGTRDDSLSFSASSSNTGLVTTSVTNERLSLNFAPGATGTAVITVHATDQFGSTKTITFAVTVTT
jgi:cyclophilin family peptidyl-prolyl cis-trans isomerase